MRLKILLLTLLFCAIISAQKQDYRYAAPIVTSPSDELRCMYFDHQGLMWIGTNSGLKSYDGYTFKTYRSTAKSPDLLPNNTILSITEDSLNGLWVGTGNGLVRMDRKSGQFQTYHLPDNRQQIIYTLFTSRDGTVWIGTDGGLTRYNAKSGEFITYNSTNTFMKTTDGSQKELGGYSVKSIVEDEQGNLYIGTWNSGLFRFNPKKGNRFFAYPKINKMNSTFALLLDSKHRLWIGSWGHGLYYIENPGNNRNPIIHCHTPAEKGYRIFSRIVEDKASGTIWAGHLDGVSVLSVEHPGTDIKEYQQMGDCSLRYNKDIAADGQGNVWLEMFYDGILHVNTNSTPFRSWLLDTHNYDRPISGVNSLCTTDGVNIWMGLQPYGIALHNRKTGRTLFNRQITGMQAISDEAMHTGISSILHRRNGEIWMANNSNGIIIYEPTQKARNITQATTPYLSDNFVNYLYQDGKDNVWIGQRTRLSIVYPDGTGHILRMHEGDDDFTRSDVRGIAQDHNGNYWVATENQGIIRISGNPADVRNLKYRHYNKTNGKYAIGDATACFEDTRHRLWAISNSGGLFLLDRSQDKFVPVNGIYHIDGDRVFAINEDKIGNLWLTTDDALIRLAFNKKGEAETQRYSQKDGLGEMLFMPNATYQYGPEIFFGGKRGIFSIKSDLPQFPSKKTGRGKLLITNIYIDGEAYEDLDSAFRKRISENAPSFIRTITIPASVDKVRFEFALLSYGNQNKYAYRLEGYDRDWHYTENGWNSATFQNLPSGTYQLYIKATSGDGFWQGIPFPITLHILPPWYQTWWAYLFYLLLLAGIVYGSIRWYKNHLRMVNRRQMNVVLTNIIHELLTPLAIISASIDELRSVAPAYKRQYGLMQNNISRLTRLLRQILEVRKSQAGQLRLKVSESDLAAFVYQTCDNIRPMAGIRKNELSIDLPPHPVNAWFDQDKMDKIIYNLLSNALKYNKEGGKVCVSLLTNSGQAVLKVSDEGIGISKDKMKHLYSRFLDGDYRKMNVKGTGIGLSLTNDLVRLHHGTISCESEEGMGTTFTITLPIRKDAYAETEIDKPTDNRLRVEREEPVTASTNEYNPATASPTPDFHPEEKEYAMLIVEDNAELLDLMQRLLSKNYKVLTAKNGRQALNVIHKEELDIVISDVMMPVMDGIELTRRIKESDDFAQLPVILLTAKTCEEDRNEGLLKGADDYLAKPFRIDELQLRVENIIKNRERIRRKFSRQTEFKIEEQHYSSPDELFVQKAISCVKDHLNDGSYDRDSFARDMCVSPSTLYNKLRAITGQNISGFMNSIRLKEACRIARAQPDIQVTELAYKVGFNSARYFTICFKKEFGMLLKEYLEKEP